MSTLLQHPWRVAVGLFVLALIRSTIIALVLPPSYGADGSGYLAYIEAFRDYDNFPEANWIIRGTTPVYPLFAYTVTLFGQTSGYMLALIQIILGATLGPDIYGALRRLHGEGALITGVLIALDPQTGLLFQHVATEALYIILLGLGFAGFWWLAQTEKTRPTTILLFGIFLGLGAFARPVGAFLIVPYVVFWIILTRSAWQAVWLSAGYGILVTGLVLLNIWRFDVVGTHNNSGLYLGTRLFGVGQLYDREHGPASERLFQRAMTCEINLSNRGQDESLQTAQDLRLCLYFTHDMSLDDISALYSQVYSEATRARPLAFAQTMVIQLGHFFIGPSDPYDYPNAQAYVTDCGRDDTSLYRDEWFSPNHFFCPAPSWLPRLPMGEMLFWALFLFNAFATAIYFVSAAFFAPRWVPSARWMMLMALGLFSYHAVVTAVAGTVLARYITVTNVYTLIACGFTWGEAWRWYQARTQVASEKQLR